MPQRELLQASTEIDKIAAVKGQPRSVDLSIMAIDREIARGETKRHILMHCDVLDEDSDGIDTTVLRSAL